MLMVIITVSPFLIFPLVTGSPTYAVSVMNSCNGPLTITDFNAGSPSCSPQHPVPAPGSPVASVIYGTKLTRSNPFYGSLKKVSYIFFSFVIVFEEIKKNFEKVFIILFLVLYESNFKDENF